MQVQDFIVGKFNIEVDQKTVFLSKWVINLKKIFFFENKMVEFFKISSRKIKY